MHRDARPEQIVAEFQRRRRLTFRILHWTAGISLSGIAAAVLIASSLHDLKDPPYWLFAGVGVLVLIFGCGALYAPHLYRCPGCGKRVHTPDPTESRNALIKDPGSCPHCGVILKAEGGSAPSSPDDAANHGTPKA
jgi:DNA-directed RNA polymerase subunit RPC12/RpoP